MDNFNKQINDSYRNLNVYRDHINFKNSSIWALLILWICTATVLFGFSMHWQDYSDKHKESSQALEQPVSKDNSSHYTYLLSGLLLSLSNLLLMLYPGHTLIKMKRRGIINRLQHQLNISENNLNQLKLLWICQKFKINQRDIICLIKNLDQYIQYKSQYQYNKSLEFKDFWITYIYSDSAKARIWGLLTAFSALVAALSISNGANLDSVFKFYREDLIVTIFFLIPFLSFMLIFISYLFKASIETTGDIFITIVNTKFPETAYMAKHAKALMNDLLFLCKA